MSYWIYKDKKFLEIDGKILALFLIADSSISAWDNSRRHPAHWWIETFDLPALLIEKDIFHKKGLECVQECLDWLNKNYPDVEHSLDSYNPYGDTYRGNGRIRGMKSFYSTRNTIPAEEFLYRYHFCLYLTPKDKKIEKGFFVIQKAEDLLSADKWFRNFRKQYPNTPCYISVRGLPGED